jgi:poly(3-hydroxybutyrate) depolymerase
MHPAMLYHAYETQRDLLRPLQIWSTHDLPPHTLGPGRLQRRIDAARAVIRLAEVTHQRPPWGIDSIAGPGETVWSVHEEETLRTPFCTLRRFIKRGAPPQPRLLIVAPMSGHFATLLRDTVRTVLVDHDVSVTDWHNAREVPVASGRFGLAEYTQTLIDFLAAGGPGGHLLAVCQPCVAALAATALMAEDEHPAAPRSLTLMSGPIDCRISPTAVNALAAKRPIAFFERMISHVSLRHRGAGRRVYPGVVQLMAFMRMNQGRHLRAFADYYSHVFNAEREAAAALEAFYAEYFAVADLPAELYLETVKLVFQQCALARGELVLSGRRVDPSAIRRTALVTIEGERDDICAPGQTLAAQDLCRRVPQYLRTHYVQPGVGHYGVFSGRRWQREIYPLVRNVVHTSGA